MISRRARLRGGAAMMLMAIEQRIYRYYEGRRLASPPPR